MTAEVLGIGVLVAMFLFATLTPINMGLLGFAAAFCVGVFVAGLPGGEIAAGFPDDLFVTMVGITYLFAVAQENGAVGRLIAAATGLVGARAMPWAMFLLAGGLTGVGALGPAVAALLLPLAMGFARRAGESPLLMGLLVIHGAQAGAFSPLSVFGGITRGVVAQADLPWNPAAPFLASLATNLVAAGLVFLVLGRRSAAPAPDRAPETLTEPPTGSRLAALLTLFALGALAVLTLVFRLQVGFVAITLGLLLSLLSVKTQRNILQRLPWPEIALITGVSTYVAVLQRMGTIDFVGDQVAGVGSFASAALLLLFIAAVVSAFASSTAVLGSLIPLAVPMLQGQAAPAAVALVAAVAVATTIVDVSPFSTAGALVVANAEPSERERVFRRLVLYGSLITVSAPLLIWIALLASI